MAALGKGALALGSEVTRMLCTDWLTFLPAGLMGTTRLPLPAPILQQKAATTNTDRAGRTGKGREEVTGIDVCAFRQTEGAPPSRRTLVPLPGTRHRAVEILPLVTRTNPPSSPDPLPSFACIGVIGAGARRPFPGFFPQMECCGQKSPSSEPLRRWQAEGVRDPRKDVRVRPPPALSPPPGQAGQVVFRACLGRGP